MKHFSNPSIQYPIFLKDKIDKAYQNIQLEMLQIYISNLFATNKKIKNSNHKSIEKF